jgi:polyhydroxybutyrate depolymerase
VLHNAGESARALADAPLLAAEALARGYAVIAPEGLPQRFADGTEAPGWRLRGTETGGRDEISFMEAVLADAADRHGIDRDRVLLTGHGLGASLVWETACLSPDTARAYAPRDGGFWGALPEDCAGPARVLHAHAPGPEAWPLQEAREGPEGAAAAMPIEAHLELARTTSGCGESAPLTAGLPEGHDGLAWSDCAEAGALRLVLHRDRGRTTAALMRHILAWFETDFPDVVPEQDSSVQQEDEVAE